MTREGFRSICYKTRARDIPPWRTTVLKREGLKVCTVKLYIEGHSCEGLDDDSHRGEGCHDGPSRKRGTLQDATVRVDDRKRGGGWDRLRLNIEATGGSNWWIASIKATVTNSCLSDAIPELAIRAAGRPGGSRSAL